MTTQESGFKNSRRRKNSGSPSGEPEFLGIGRLGRPHGVAGEIQFFVLTDFPERIVPGKRIYIGRDHEPVVLDKIRPHTNKLLVTFKGIAGRDSVDQYRNQYVFVSMSDVPPLPDGEYYHHQLIGLEVLNEDGETLGNIAEIIETGANDVYVVRRDERQDLLLPGIPDVVLNIDLDQKSMTVRLMPGLLPEE